MTNKVFFGQLEQAIMDVVWKRDVVTVREVLDSLARRTTAYTTVMTVMNRLVQQGVLKRQMNKEGAYQYRATTSRQLLYASAARRHAQDLVRHYGDVALAQFIDTLDRIPEKKLAELKRRLKNS